MLSKAFSKYMKFTQHGVFRSWHCSRICRRVNMCSPQDHPFLNSAGSLRRIGSRAVDILFRITLLKTLLVMDSSVIPLQFLQRLWFPFFGSLKISPVFQSKGISLSSHISLKICVRVSVMTSPPAISISALTPSAPGAFPDFMLFIADLTSFAYWHVGIRLFQGCPLLLWVLLCWGWYRSAFSTVVFVFLHSLLSSRLHLSLECHCF